MVLSVVRAVSGEDARALWRLPLQRGRRCNGGRGEVGAGESSDGALQLGETICQRRVETKRHGAFAFGGLTAFGSPCKHEKLQFNTPQMRPRYTKWVQR